MRAAAKTFPIAIILALLALWPAIARGQDPPRPPPTPPSQPAPAPTPTPAPTPATPATPAPDPAPAPDTNTNRSAPNTNVKPIFPDALDTIREMEANRRARDASERQWAVIRRAAFVDGTNRMLAFRHALAVVPVGSEAPTAAAMKSILKQAEDVRKKIPQIIEYLDGKKTKLRKKDLATWATPTDAIVELLAVLRRVNPDLESFARNEHQFNAAKSQKLIADLQVVQELLQRLDQTF